MLVGGLGEDGRGFILDDLSIRGGPRKWAERDIAGFDRHGAAAIVIKVNQGGDMVRHTLESVRPDLPIIVVRASRPYAPNRSPRFVRSAGSRMSALLPRSKTICAG